MFTFFFDERLERLHMCPPASTNDAPPLPSPLLLLLLLSGASLGSRLVVRPSPLYPLPAAPAHASLPLLWRPSRSVQPRGPLHLSLSLSFFSAPLRRESRRRPTLNLYCGFACLQDGQCDRTCFTEECGWDGQDCFVRRMFPEVYEALMSMVDTSCMLYNRDFDCSSKCKKQYEHLLSAHENSCCLSAGFDVLSSILSVEVKHPLVDKKDIWRPDRSIAYLEQMCGMSFDRTCSHGRARQQIVIRTSIFQGEGEGGGLTDARRLLEDGEKMKEIQGVIQKSVAQRLRLVNQDIARINTRLAPFNGLDIETFIDSGIYADRSLLLLKNQVRLTEAGKDVKGKREE